MGTSWLLLSIYTNKGQMVSCLRNNWGRICRASTAKNQCNWCIFTGATPSQGCFSRFQSLWTIISKKVSISRQNGPQCNVFSPFCYFSAAKRSILLTSNSPKSLVIEFVLRCWINHTFLLYANRWELFSTVPYVHGISCFTSIFAYYRLLFCFDLILPNL